MKYATTFSGIGGWELGLNACGWKLQWQCEIHEWCRGLLADQFGVPIEQDIKTVCDETLSPVDALVGSAPCQPFSGSGDMRGLADARHLYPAFIRLVRKVKPRWVLLEQVPNIFSIPGAFEHYITGLAALRYDVLWHCIPARALGAPIERNRLYIVALSQCQRRAGILCRKPRIREMPPTIWPPASLDSPGALVEAIEQRMGEPALFGSSHGVPTELALAGYGNAVVPQMAWLIGQAINEIEITFKRLE